MKRITIILIFLLWFGAAFGATETFYVCQGGDGTLPETNACATAYDAADFNTAGNWDVDDQDDGKIGPNDDVVILSDGGTIAGVLTIQQPGLSGKPITIKNATGYRPKVWEIFGNSQDYITVQGITVTGNIHASGDNWVIDHVLADGDDQSISFKSTTQTIDLDLTISGGTVLWGFGNESSSTAADPGVKDFGTAATRYNSVSASGNWASVTEINCHGTSIAFDLAQIRNLLMTKSLKANNTLMTGLFCDLPRGLTGSIQVNNTSTGGALSDLPTGLTGDVQVNNTSATGTLLDLPRGLTGIVYLNSVPVTGALSDLPTGLTGNLDLASTLSTGDIADFPTGLAGNVYLNNSSVSDYSAASWPLPTGNGKTLDFDDLTGLDQTEVDNILCHLDTYGATGGTLDLTGTTAPSAAGLACKTNLEGKGWTVSVTP